MPLFNYGRDPGYAPGGRAVSYSPNESKAFKILADTNAFGAQPGQYSQKEIDWANSMLPSGPTGPTINKRLQSPLGLDRAGAFQFAQALRAGQIGPNSPIYAGFNPAQQQLANSYQAAAYPNLLGPNARMDVSPEKLGSLGQSAINAHHVTGQGMLPGIPANANTIGGTSPMGGAPMGMAGTSPNAHIAGELASFNTQWNDQNDPGGFIRKHQQRLTDQANAVPNLNNSGALYGIGGDRTYSGA